MKKMNPVLLVILFIVTSILIIIFKKNNEKDNDKIISNGMFTTGTVIFFSPGKGAMIVPGMINSPPQPAELEYTYVINNKTYTNKYGEGKYKMPKKGVNEGEQYLVVFNKYSSNKSLMLFDYPIKTESDFEKYMDKFKKYPPNLKW